MNAGRKVAYVVDDEALLVAWIREPVPGGSIRITLGQDRPDEDAARLATQLSLRPLSSGVTVVEAATVGPP